MAVVKADIAPPLALVQQGTLQHGAYPLGSEYIDLGLRQLCDVRAEKHAVPVEVVVIAGDIIDVGEVLQKILLGRHAGSAPLIGVAAAAVIRGILKNVSPADVVKPADGGQDPLHCPGGVLSFVKYGQDSLHQKGVVLPAVEPAAQTGLYPPQLIVPVFFALYVFYLPHDAADLAAVVGKAGVKKPAPAHTPIPVVGLIIQRAGVGGGAGLPDHFLQGGSAVGMDAPVIGNGVIVFRNIHLNHAPVFKIRLEVQHIADGVVAENAGAGAGCQQIIALLIGFPLYPRGHVLHRNHRPQRPAGLV